MNNKLDITTIIILILMTLLLLIGVYVNDLRIQVDHIRDKEAKNYTFDINYSITLPTPGETAKISNVIYRNR